MQRGVLPGLVILLVAVDLAFIGHSLPRALSGDEWRYLYYAGNVLEGYYSPTPRVFLWNGPGYPVLLTPFVGLGWPDGARYLNAFLHGGAVIYAWLILRTRLRTGWALGAVAALALYPPLLEHIPLLYTETLCFFLVTGWLYHSLRAADGFGHVVSAGVHLALLALTKVIFGYALLAWLLALLVWSLHGHIQILRPYAISAALALTLCVPYLTYTYELTGRVFYWSSAGGNSLYWLASPYDGEWGDWYHQGWVNKNRKLRARHKRIFDRAAGLTVNPKLSGEEQLFNLSTPQAADLFMKRARSNIRKHPKRFARNWLANLSRLLFDVPCTVRKTPRVNLYSVSNLLLVVATAWAFVHALRRRLRLDRAWLPLALFGLLGLGAYSLSSATARFLIPFVPILWLGTFCWLSAGPIGRCRQGEVSGA